MYSNFEEYVSVGDIEMQPNTIRYGGKDIARVKVRDRSGFALILSHDQLNTPQ